MGNQRKMLRQHSAHIKPELLLSINRSRWKGLKYHASHKAMKIL